MKIHQQLERQESFGDNDDRSDNPWMPYLDDDHKASGTNLSSVDLSRGISSPEVVNRLDRQEIKPGLPAIIGKNQRCLNNRSIRDYATTMPTSNLNSNTVDGVVREADNLSQDGWRPIAMIDAAGSGGKLGASGNSSIIMRRGGSYKLFVPGGAVSTIDLPNDGSETIVGRGGVRYQNVIDSSTNDLDLDIINDDYVSRRHFSISFNKDDNLVISDLNSSNGTHIVTQEVAKMNDDIKRYNIDSGNYPLIPEQLRALSVDDIINYAESHPTSNLNPDTAERFADVIKSMGLSIPPIAMIDCSNDDGGGQTFVLFDARHDKADLRKNTMCSIMDPMQYDGFRGYIGVSYGTVVHLGQSHYTDCFRYDKDLGDNQVNIACSKDLADIWGSWRSDGCSTNLVVAREHSYDNNDRGKARGRRVVRSRGSVERHVDDRKKRVFKVGNKVVGAMYTIRPERNSMGNWLERSGQWHEMKDPVKYPVGAFSDNGRLYPILCRDSKVINGSVGVSEGSEAVLIDGDSPQIRKLTDSVADDVVRLTAQRYGENPHSIVDDDEMLPVLRVINSDVAVALRYDLAKVDGLCEHYYDHTSGKHKVIKLSEFVRLGFGVCRQQAMLAAVILENLSNRGIVVGSAGVERNYNILKSDGLQEGHEWATFTNSVTGLKYVIDPAQGFTGTKEDAYRACMANGRQWSYFIDKAEYEEVAARAKQ